MPTAYVSMGSNIEPEKNIRAALRLIASKVQVASVSTVYRTEPVGMAGQDFFYNCVVEVQTGLPPEELKFSVLRPIEDTLGRIRGNDKNWPRTIDLDLIIYDGLRIEKEGLKLPDPEIMTRPFLAVPLSELAPEIKVPGTGQNAKEIASSMDAAGMQALDDYTGELRDLVR